jgi:two-component system invasion response regulator UvrY
LLEQAKETMINILLADDHSVVRQYIKLILQEEFNGSFIDEAENAESLVQKATEKDWDIVITDFSMPGMSGLEALGKIKLIKPDLPVFILSAHPEEDLANKVLTAGAANYLSKEASPDELVKAIRKQLGI